MQVLWLLDAGGDFCRTSILKEGLDHSVPYRHNHNESQRSDLNDEDSEKLEAIWSRTIEKCQSITLKRFLQKEGKLLSVSVSQGISRNLYLASCYRVIYSLCSFLFNIISFSYCHFFWIDICFLHCLVTSTRYCELGHWGLCGCATWEYAVVYCNQRVNYFSF